MTPQEQRNELDIQRRQVDFDTYDVTVDELLRRVERGRVDVAPAYQRKFRWDGERQSKLVESIFLGIPIPPLFMATNQIIGTSSNWEVVDGLQRVTTLVNFAGNDNARTRIGLKGSPLKLEKLEKLNSFHQFSFSDLPGDLRGLFEDRPLKVIVLNDKSEIRVRFDLFERINTGGIKLTHQEVRECVFRGDFIDLIDTLSERPSFEAVVRLPVSSKNDGTPQEYVLRFFAYLERYMQFEHAVKEFLDEFTITARDSPQVEKRTKIFEKTFDYLERCFPEGIKSRKGTTPVNLYEGVAVGAALAFKENPRLSLPRDLTWVLGDELKQYISGATNTRSRVRGRIEYCRDKFLGR
ncbi:DUF262 domain-containing protein [Streptosporangium sp. NPDC000563]|uniref:DUF262 domain-containing protein n=1 Tax=Streptosporangium sp. NPDC000563 TaxID=3154366 RepID=UPI003330E5EB